MQLWILLLAMIVILGVKPDTPTIQELPHTVKVSSGFYLKEVSKHTLIFSETTPLIISLNFTWSPKQDFLPNHYVNRCKIHSFEPACIIHKQLIQNLQSLNDRIEVLYSTLTDEHAYPTEQSYDMPPHEVIYNEAKEFNDDENNFRRPNLIPQPNSTNITEPHDIEERQVVVGALAVGYLAHMAYNYFNSPSNTEEIYNEVKLGVRHVEKGIIMNTNNIIRLDNKIHGEMHSIFDRFVTIAKSDRAKTMDLLKSFCIWHHENLSFSS